MNTCENCGREHNGRSKLLCAQCNNPGALNDRKRLGERTNNSQRAGHLELADQAARADTEGWPYDDED